MFGFGFLFGHKFGFYFGYGFGFVLGVAFGFGCGVVYAFGSNFGFWCFVLVLYIVLVLV